MSNSVGYDKYFFNQGDYVRSKRTGSYDKVPNHPNQSCYIQSVHNASYTPRNELSYPCILLKEYSTSDVSMVTCVFKLTECQLRYYTSKGVTGSLKTYTLKSKTASLDATYSCQLQLYTSDADISGLNTFYKTKLPFSYSYLKVIIMTKSNDIFGLPITIL